MEAFEIEIPGNLPNDDIIDINISDVMAAIQRADPMFSTNTAPAGGGGGGAESNMDQQDQMQHPGQQQQQQQDSTQTTQQAANTARCIRRRAYVRIHEQPASKALRFRYECEGRSAGSIPGVNSTPENKTFPTIEIADYVGLAVVVVSCVTKDPPYRPHPHNLVGKEGCKKGVCTLQIKPDTMRAVFSNLGIQCVKKKDIESALRAREEIRVDPFKTGFSHRFQPASIDLNSVRLCFQVFLEDTNGRFTKPLTPVVSDPIYDKKAMSDLVICKLCKCSSTVTGGKEIILLCEKVTKEDIAVRFFEEKDGQVIWEAYGEFQHTDVHKQTAINFRTPKYRTLDVEQPVKAYIQLKRPSDGATSEPLQFDFLPLDSEPGYLKRKRQKFAGEASSHLFRFQAQEQKNLQDQHQPQDGHHHMGFLNLNQGTAIKAEPRDTSPLPYGLFPNSTTYRLPENSPSPQPLSPPAPLYNTPSPYNMAAGGGNMMSPNAQQYGGGAAAAGSLSPNMTVDMNDGGGQYHAQYQPQPSHSMSNYNQMPPQIQQQPQHQQQQQQQQQHHWNLPPATTTSTMNNLLTTNSTLVASQPQWSMPSGIKQEQMQTVNSLSTNPFMMGASGAQHHQPQHHQQNHHQQPQQPHHQQTTSNMNLNEAPNISSLLDMDSEQLIQFNSAELSGLSLS